jgi:hypothetical protein
VFICNAANSAVRRPWMSHRLRSFLLSAKFRFPSAPEKALGIELPKNFDQARNHTRPSRLMTGADTGAIVAMKVLVEQQTIPPVGILLEFFRFPEHRPLAGLITQEDRSPSGTRS